MANGTVIINIKINIFLFSLGISNFQICPTFFFLGGENEKSPDCRAGAQSVSQVPTMPSASARRFGSTSEVPWPGGLEASIYDVHHAHHMMYLIVTDYIYILY